jgi:hypothetical protein
MDHGLSLSILAAKKAASLPQNAYGFLMNYVFQEVEISDER